MPFVGEGVRLDDALDIDNIVFGEGLIRIDADSRAAIGLLDVDAFGENRGYAQSLERNSVAIGNVASRLADIGGKAGAAKGKQHSYLEQSMQFTVEIHPALLPPSLRWNALSLYAL